MLSPECLGELRAAWLPHIPDAALDRLCDLLDKGSPLLISGCFTKALPMGCLASHIAWHHPMTCEQTVDLATIHAMQVEAIVACEGFGFSFETLCQNSRQLS